MSNRRCAPVNDPEHARVLDTAIPPTDPAPLTGPQLRAIGRGARHELCWATREVRHEVRAWWQLAEQIPDATMRADALGSLAGKGHFTHGVALFGILPARREPGLLRALVAFQVAANFIDYASERGAAWRQASGGSLMLAFVDAVDVEGAPQDYYADHPWHDDGGYLRALVAACRAGCAALPRYDIARRMLIREARRARALEIVHDPQPLRRDAAVLRFAVEEYGAETEAAWFELAAGTSNALSVIVLLALAADPTVTEADLQATLKAYIWVAAISTMLDSFVDQAEDEANGDWSAIGYYGDGSAAADRLAYLVDRALREVVRLRDGERHALIVSSMIALLLSRDTARRDPLGTVTVRLVRAGGSLTRLLLPMLRTWRVVFRLQRA